MRTTFNRKKQILPELIGVNQRIEIAIGGRYDSNIQREPPGCPQPHDLPALNGAEEFGLGI